MFARVIFWRLRKRYDALSYQANLPSRSHPGASASRSHSATSAKPSQTDCTAQFSMSATVAALLARETADRSPVTRTVSGVLGSSTASTCGGKRFSSPYSRDRVVTAGEAIGGDATISTAAGHRLVVGSPPRCPLGLAEAQQDKAGRVAMMPRAQKKTLRRSGRQRVAF